ncbi:MAG: VWA domain-containing protein [Verrucomicrobiota bacterium]
MSWIAFQWPWMLLLLGLLPFIRMQMKRAEALNLKTIRALESSISIDQRRRRHRHRILLWALVFMIIALARPGYAPEKKSIQKSGRDVVFLLDVSRSMLAEDCYPSRLEVAKQAVRDCLGSFSNDRVGLVIYAGSSSILCPLTSDYEFLKYMLEQAQPRSVDFGGTLLLSAVEKVVSQVFDVSRASYQDLILLTDGEDHGPEMKKVAEVFNQTNDSLLIVGLGDPSVGSKIPIIDDEGNESFLEHQGRPVLTQLQERGLLELERLSKGSKYVSVKTSPFHLGDMYLDFAKDKKRDGGIGSNFDIVYQEAAFFFIIVSLILLLWVEFLFFVGQGDQKWLLLKQKLVKRRTLLVALLVVSQSCFADDNNSPSLLFERAMKLTAEGKYEEAQMLWNELANHSEMTSSKPQAVIALNLALTTKREIKEIVDQSKEELLETALIKCNKAEQYLLQAARLRPDYARPGMQLQELDRLRQNIYNKIEEKKSEEEEADQELQQIIELLRQLKDDQKNFQTEVIEKGKLKQRRQRKIPKEMKQRLIESVPTTGQVEAYVLKQEALHERGVDMHIRFLELDKKMKAITYALPSESFESILNEPIALMNKALESQKRAVQFLNEFNTWWPATQRQEDAVRLMNKILTLFPQQDGGFSDQYSDDWEEAEDFEEWDESESGDASSLSSRSEGPMQSFTELQTMPAPNFSAEEIMAQELENQQFREEERTKSSLGKVEKDW